MARHVRTWARIALVIGAFYELGTGSDKVQAQLASWTQVGMLTCKLNPSIGFVVFGHQSMECRFTQNPPFPPQAYEVALNTVGIDRPRDGHFHVRPTHTRGVLVRIGETPNCARRHIWPLTAAVPSLSYPQRIRPMLTLVQVNEDYTGV